MKLLLVDIDGTVADMGKGIPGRRAIYDYERVCEDDPHTDIIELVQMLRGTGDVVVVWLSGRDDNSCDVTREWLVTNGAALPGDMLVMRPTGDYRPDDIVKWELFEQHIKPRYGDPWLILDDRDRVVAMWRRQGFRCLQVAEGDF